MSAGILKIAPDPDPFAITSPSVMAQRLNRLASEGYEVIPHRESALIMLRFRSKTKGVPSPIMILGNGDLATFEGWPYELDRIFIGAGDGVKFERFIAGVLSCSQSGQNRFR